MKKLTEVEIIEQATEMLNEPNPERQEDVEVVVQWIINQSKLL